ncbi:MAG: hypothetical protein OEZ33_03355 [Gammaproteobacteria bacterium]|nr:hypothetical protein [Gammaproteobacteria bacterium]
MNQDEFACYNPDIAKLDQRLNPKLSALFDNGCPSRLLFFPRAAAINQLRLIQLLRINGLFPRFKSHVANYLFIQQAYKVCKPF